MLQKHRSYKIGIVTGAFDLIHPGYIRLFADAKSICDYLIVALHEDPSLENPKKPKPIFSVEERKLILLSMRFVDDVISYRTEKDLDVILRVADVKINGSDHEGETTRPNLSIPTFYHKRDHDWSATKVRELVLASCPPK